MSRLSPNRNQRSKGIKIKHVLQICLLVAICFWLIYQVKHSHDRKKEFDQSDKVLPRRESTGGMIKLGRKDTHSQVEEIVSKNAEHDEELEEEAEEDKNEEDAQGEKKIRGNENEDLGGDEEEEEIDEHEREKLEMVIDQEEDFVNDEEREDGDDQENEEKHSEDSKKDVSVEDVDHDGDDMSSGDNMSSHEAREEHYKADDASSAVTHDTQINRENSSEHLDLVLGKEKKEHNSEETNTSENRKQLGVENGEMARGSNGFDVTIKETFLGNYQNGSFSNNTLIEGSEHRLEVTNSSTEVRLGDRSSSSWNITESLPGNSLNGSISIFSPKSKGVSSKSELPKSFESVQIGTSEASMDAGDGKNDIFDSIMPEIFEQVPHDPIDFSDTSNSLEDKDVPANLDTLLHGIWNQGTHTKDAAAE